MKYCYVPKKFNTEHASIIDAANAIIAQFAAEGFVLSLRQLYYQFISRDLFPNTWISAEGTKNNQANYKRLGDIISAARRAGKVDWSAIEDRTRNLQTFNAWTSPAQIVQACAKQYNVDLWANQEYRCEVWVEKDALVGVLQVACAPYRVPYFSCRGYTSDSEIWGAAQRLAGYIVDDDKQAVVLHLGDHDPSGKDMTRDIEDRLNLFVANRNPLHRIEVRRLALNYDQVQQYNPPPNPAKSTDARYRGYQQEFGDESWELDALTPQVITDLIRDELDSLIDAAAWEAAERRRDTGRTQLRRLAANWDKVVTGLADEEDNE